MALSTDLDPVGTMSLVALEDVMASDLHVVNAARVSFGKRQDELGEKDAGLIDYLMKNRHGTPFEHGAFLFRIKCPLWIAREWQRHRIGSYNEQSTRYSKVIPEFMMFDRARTQVGKPGAYSFEDGGDELTARMQAVFADITQRAREAYEELTELGLAKEQAGRIFPMVLCTQFVWTVNPRSLMNFISLRNHDHAQEEIRWYAQQVEDMFQAHMPLTHLAFVKNGRTAP